MKQTKSPVAALSIKVVILLLLAFFAGFFVVDDKVAYTLGLVFGGTFTILKIILMKRTIARAVARAPQSAQYYSNANYMLRYVLSFVVLFVGLVSPYFHPVGVAIGLLVLKPAAYWQGKTEPPTPKDGSVEWLEWEDEDDESSDF